MLLEFKCSNFRSIKDEVEFSMLAGTDTSMEENVVEFSNYKVLRSAVIYGANGSGKSSLLRAIASMRSLVLDSVSIRPEQKIIQRAHKLSPADAPTEFFIQFTEDDRRYAYGFSIVKGFIDEEHLYYFPNGKKTVVFERKGLDVTPGSKYTGGFGLAKEALKDNRLFLSCAANFSSVKETEMAYRFFATDLVTYKVSARDNPSFWTGYSLAMMESDPELKQMFLDTLISLGTKAQGVDITSERVLFGDLPKSERDRFSDSEERFLNETDGVRRNAGVLYGDTSGKNFEVDIREESSGVQALFSMICPIMDILRGDKVLICDELETSLHEFIVYEIVKMFQDAHPDMSAQLIFTTHNTTLLDADLFRRDQIWFTEMSDDRTTDLYSLVEIRDVRKTEDKGRQYLKGKYGGIPVLSPDFFKSFKSRK